MPPTRFEIREGFEKEVFGNLEKTNTKMPKNAKNQEEGKSAGLESLD